jgi:hypothetical protein
MLRDVPKEHLDNAHWPFGRKKTTGQKGRTLRQAQDSCIRIFSGSANRLREMLVQALPERAILQQAVNRILRAQTPQEVKKYSKGRFKRKCARWFAYAVGQLPHSVAPHQVFEMYRQRFGIETSYCQTLVLPPGAV